MMDKRNRKGGRKRNVEISNVLENLSDNFQKEFPFLVHYKGIKKLHKQVPEQKKSQYAYFQVRCLKQIALELQNQLDTIDKEELDYYIIKRHYEESSRYFVSPTLAGAPLAGLIRVIPDPVRKYLVTNLLIMRDYLRTKLQEFEYNIERFSVNA
jgi:ribosomal protein S6